MPSRMLSISGDCRLSETSTLPYTRVLLPVYFCASDTLLLDHHWLGATFVCVNFSLLSRFHCKREIIANHLRVFAAAYIVSPPIKLATPPCMQTRSARIETRESKFGNRSLRFFSATVVLGTNASSQWSR